MATKKEVEYKWKFAIGTTSRVPGRTDLHYLIADFDGTYEVPLVMRTLQSRIVSQRTPNGIHVFTDLRLSFANMNILLKKLDADPSWVRIGHNRGYWFLADKASIEFSWPVERMTLKWSDPYGEKR